MLWCLVFLALIVGLLKFVSLSKDERLDKIPGPPGIFLLENALDFVMTPVQLFYYIIKLTYKYGGMYKFKMGPKYFVVITTPEDVETLISGSQNNEKGFVYSFLKPWLQDGLLLSDGAKWHKRRKILTPAFHFNILQHLKVQLEENSRKLVDSLQKEVGKVQTDIGSYTVSYTLNSISETAMGVKLDEDDNGNKYREAVANIGYTIVLRLQRIWLHPDILFSFTGLGKTQKSSLNYMNWFIEDVIDKRSSSDEHNQILVQVTNNVEEINVGSKKRLAMLDLLLQSERTGAIDRKGIGEEVDTFMFEGHDTTSAALQFFFMLIANHPEVQEKIVEECVSIFGTTTRTTSMSDLAQMKYLENCIKESMRLYPPVYFISRKLNKTTTFSNYEVPAGTDCTVIIYNLHRSNYFKDPLRFRPERFIDEAPTWHPYAYIPFSAGPRNCIGQKFAMMEMKLAVSSVLRRYQILPVTKPHQIVITPDIVLRTKNPIYVQFMNREHKYITNVI